MYFFVHKRTGSVAQWYSIYRFRILEIAQHDSEIFICMMIAFRSEDYDLLRMVYLYVLSTAYTYVICPEYWKLKKRAEIQEEFHTFASA